MNFLKMSVVWLFLLPNVVSAELLSVQVEQVFLRDKPSFLGKNGVRLQYAEQVENEKAENGWNYVKSLQNGSKGWVHTSALSEKTIVLNASQKLSNSSVSQSEVLMAGKGFNKQVETEYKKQNSKLNFTLVDTIEKSNRVNTQELIVFAKNGKLNL